MNHIWGCVVKSFLVYVFDQISFDLVLKIIRKLSACVRESSFRNTKKFSFLIWWKTKIFCGINCIFSKYCEFLLFMLSGGYLIPKASLQWFYSPTAIAEKRREVIHFPNSVTWIGNGFLLCNNLGNLTLCYERPITSNCKISRCSGQKWNDYFECSASILSEKS